MKNKLKAVEIFHNAFGITNRETPIAFTNDKEIKLRFDLMAEENEEYFEAAKNNDLVEVADAYALYSLRNNVISRNAR